MTFRMLALGLAGVFVTQACAPLAPSPAPAATMPTAAATLGPIGASGVAGTVSFTRLAEGVRVDAHVTGLKPGAEHGFHVHEIGLCEDPDGQSAGDHFDPFDKPHGHPDSVDSHAGDLPNLEADAQGVARLSYVAPRLSIDTGANAVLGRSVIVHREPDDYRSQPAGDSGDRIGCGVIRGGGA